MLNRFLGKCVQVNHSCPKHPVGQFKREVNSRCVARLPVDRCAAKYEKHTERLSLRIKRHWQLGLVCFNSLHHLLAMLSPGTHGELVYDATSKGPPAHGRQACGGWYTSQMNEMCSKYLLFPLHATECV